MTQASSHPLILFRYRALGDSTEDEKCLKPIFVERQLYFPSRRELNDPYECAVPDLAKIPKPRLEPFIRERVKRLPGYDALPRKERRITVAHLLKEKTLRAVRADIQSEVDRLGILSLSAQRDDILMWSHYANGHRGLCLGFAASDNDPFFGRALRVDYSTARPMFDPRDDDFTASKKVVLTKSTHWDYEQEWRIIEVKGKGLYRFPRPALKSVVFGCRTTESDKEKVRKWIADGGLNPQLYQAREDSREFTVTISAIT